MSFFDAIAADDVTLHGLEKWTCHMFEQLGWMTLAYKSGRTDKVASYIVSINKLKTSIESRLKIITSEDAKIDLANLLTKVKHLQKVVSKVFDTEQIKKSVCDKCTLPAKKAQDKESVETGETEESEESEEHDNKTKLKQDGGAKSKTNKTSKHISSRPKISKTSNLMKKLSKISSKKGSKKTSKKESKKSSKKSHKVSQKKQDQPLIKKLSKKSSKKNYKTAENKIFKKV